jgi:WD40 repeat protein
VDLPSNASDNGVKMPVTSIAFRPERKEFKHGGVILASYADGRLVHWHFVTGQLLSTIKLESDVGANVVKYSPTGHIFAAAGSESRISIYDGHTQKFKYHLCSGKGDETAGHSNRIFALSFSPVLSKSLIPFRPITTLLYQPVGMIRFKSGISRNDKASVRSFRLTSAEILWTLIQLENAY